MRAILISIKPQHTEKIFAFEKDDELRKIIPRLPPPFKCCVYCTLSGPAEIRKRIGGGLVIGEFICDGIDTIHGTDARAYEERNAKSKSCVSNEQLLQYLNGGDKLSFMHIGERILYDKPKSLADFGLWKPPQSWCYVGEV